MRVARSLTVTNSVTFSTLFSAAAASISSWERMAAISLFSLRCFAPKLFLVLSFMRAYVSFTCFWISFCISSCSSGVMAGLKRSFFRPFPPPCAWAAAPPFLEPSFFLGDFSAWTLVTSTFWEPPLLMRSRFLPFLGSNWERSILPTTLKGAPLFEVSSAGVGAGFSSGTGSSSMGSDSGSGSATGSGSGSATGSGSGSGSTTGSGSGSTTGSGSGSTTGSGSGCSSAG